MKIATELGKYCVYCYFSENMASHRAAADTTWITTVLVIAAAATLALLPSANGEDMTCSPGEGCTSITLFIDVSLLMASSVAVFRLMPRSVTMQSNYQTRVKCTQLK